MSAVYRPETLVRAPAPWFAVFAVGAAAAFAYPVARPAAAYVRQDAPAVRVRSPGLAAFGTPAAAPPVVAQIPRAAFFRPDPAPLVRKPWFALFAPPDPVYNFAGVVVQSPAPYARDPAPLAAFRNGPAAWQIVAASVPASVPATVAAYLRAEARAGLPATPLAGLFTPPDPFYNFDGPVLQSATIYARSDPFQQPAEPGPAQFAVVTVPPFVYPTPLAVLAPRFEWSDAWSLIPVPWAALDSTIPQSIFLGDPTPAGSYARAERALYILPAPDILPATPPADFVYSTQLVGYARELRAVLAPMTPDVLPAPPAAPVPPSPLAGGRAYVRDVLAPPARGPWFALYAPPDPVYRFNGPVLQRWQAYTRFEWSAAWDRKPFPMAAFLSTIVYTSGRPKSGGFVRTDANATRDGTPNTTRTRSPNTRRG